MWEFLRKIFDVSDFPARWHCGRWTSGHGWLHVLSDVGVWSAYVTIPCVLIYFASRKRTLPFRNVFWLFGAFILACGTTHLMEAIIFWWPAYRLAGLIKLFTAVVSWATVFALIPVVPQALALRTPTELDQEVKERRRAEEQLRQMHVDLERRVIERTTELTHANAALRRSEERYRVLVQALSQIVWATAPDGTIVEDSPSWRAFTGQTYDEWKGTGWLNALHPDDHARAKADWAHAVETRSHYRTEYRLRNASGEYRYTEASGVPVLDTDGKIVEWIGVNIDVTEKRLASSALQDADRRKDQFLAMLGHELRNPLSGITGAAQVLAHLGTLDTDAREMQQIIERQSGHMARMIDDLLEVSRISRGKIQIQPRLTDLREQVQQAFEDFRQEFSKARLEANLQLPEAPLWANCDSTRLSQILVNLLQNAVKFTDPGGQVTVSLAASSDAKEARITISDTGIGLSPEFQKQIFEPFNQGDGSLQRSRGGLGLGLALVKGLIELHGGRATARSAGTGKGSEFSVTLPLAEAGAVEKETPRPVTYARNGLKILIVEDRSDISDPLRRLLEKDQHQVRVAVDGPAGLEAARQSPPDVVLCDIGLAEGMDGYAVAAALKRDPLTNRALLIAVTGYGQEEDRVRGLRHGFDHYLTKPVNCDMLRGLIATRFPPQ